MAFDDASSVVTDPELVSFLEINSRLQDEALALAELLSTQAENPSEETSAPPYLDQDPPQDIQAAYQRLNSIVAVLRGQNRRVAHITRQSKASTAASRAELDRLHLSLQNLYYEQKHLLGEIATCENFPHPFQRLPMVSEETFLGLHPEWKEKRLLKEPPVKMDQESEEVGEGETAQVENAEAYGEEGYMKARIKEERKEREELGKTVQELSKKKMELVKENAKRKEELGKLDKDLEHFIDVSTNLLDL
ncbi:MAG: hypothetical protein M1831_003841 [Alyxoria varia]|nr:MAG: hypothetical protein M1831_003841 [Alyxoria varia]